MITKHTLSTYDRKLQELQNCILEMGEGVLISLQITQRAVSERDEALSKEIKANDKQINALGERIEQQVTEALALMNPMAVDLRLITSALKIAVALERAGDIAKNTVKKLTKLEQDVPASIQPMLSALISTDHAMMSAALEAVRNNDTAQAIAVWKRDDEADDQCHAIFEALRTMIQNDPKHALTMVDIMFAAKNLERIADYATNLAKSVHYVLTGEKPKKSVLLAQE